MYVNGLKSAEAHLSEDYNIDGNICIQGGIKVFSEDRGYLINAATKDFYFKEFPNLPLLGY